MTTVYAHSLPDEPDRSKWEPIADHEQRVAWRCRAFLQPLDPALGEWGETLGRWHDLGKYSDRWQAYIRGEIAGSVDHKTAGARHAATTIPGLGRLLAYGIAGHHGGMPDWIGDGQHGLKVRLTTGPMEPVDAAPAALLAAPSLRMPALPFDREDALRRGFQMSLLTRVCFSALCDADFRATEEFVRPGQAAQRVGPTVTLAAMADRLRTHLDELQIRQPDRPVNVVRREVRQAAIDAAEIPPGLFSLDVPTGGGKTLASLEFALRHADRHGLERVIYAIPFTSIIEQTATVFRSVFDGLDPHAVLEHHSSLDPARETFRSRLAAEDFDAPLVVTTNVQVFESLFANKPSRCRKVHRLARSVIVLDEAQTLPVRLLAPCLAVLRELCELLGSTVVLCTATQPAVERRADFPIGLTGVRPIVADPPDLHRRMRRVTCHDLRPIEDEPLAERLAGHERVLAITNTRSHARTLSRLLVDRTGTDGRSTSAR